ncbi:MAG: MFS transporter [Betaproteobacteria bacterium]|nr:MFS transporter [Betaproteobacteria bacterium]
MPAFPQQSEGSWLAQLCLSRAAFALIFTTYAAAIPLLMVDWNMSASEAGLIQSAWHVGYLVSLFSIGFLADRYGAKRVFLSSSVAAAASALVFAVFADDFLSGMILYGLTGLFSGGSYTPGLTLISERFVSQRRGRAMGFYIAAASFGYALSLFLTGMLTPVVGWRGAFVVTACGPALGLAMAWYALRQTPNVVHPPAPEHAAQGSLPAVVGNRPAMLLIWAYVFHSWELLGMKAWLPAYFAASSRETGFGAIEAASLGAMLAALAYVASMAGSVAGGVLSDRIGRTLTILLMSCASLFCSFTFGWMYGLPVLLLVLIALFYSFTAIGDSSVYSTAITELVAPRHIGAAYSVRSVLGFGAGAMSPWIFGLVLDATRPGNTELLAWGLAFCSLGVGGLLGPLATWKLRARPEARRMAGGKR